MKTSASKSINNNSLEIFHKEKFRTVALNCIHTLDVWSQSHQSGVSARGGSGHFDLKHKIK